MNICFKNSNAPAKCVNNYEFGILNQGYFRSK